MRTGLRYALTTLLAFGVLEGLVLVGTEVHDDRTNPGETIKAVQRLATQDKVDFILAPYGSGLNLAAAPIFAKYGYPQVTSTSITDKIDALTKRYPGIFFTLGTTTSFAGAVADILKKMRDEGRIGNRVGHRVRLRCLVRLRQGGHLGRRLRLVFRLRRIARIRLRERPVRLLWRLGRLHRRRLRC